MTIDAVTIDPDLARLAGAYGVAVDYQDQLKRTVHIAAESVVAVLDALGVDASTPAAVAEALRSVAQRSATPPVVVMRSSESARVPVVTGELVLEDGERRPVERAGDGVRLGPGLPLGWHSLETDDRVIPVVVAPDRLEPTPGRQWGWMSQLYANPSSQAWGRVGDLGDLATLAEWTGRAGGGLLLVNPLHAVAPTPPLQPSPYYPASRRWTNPLYLRLEQTSAYLTADHETQRRVDDMRPPADAERVDRDTAWVAKRQALELLWAGQRHRVPRADGDVEAFATWCAISEVHGNDWRQWPPELHRPDSAAVERVRRDLDDRVQFWAWLQHLCDEQLHVAQRRATDAGMPIGIVHDLAVGTDPAGADGWVLQDALALGARIGAPPDSFNQQGQDWGMPPWHPQRLAELGYAPLRDMLRSVLRHAGGVRIDHVLGVFRMWWVPADGTAKQGTYVSYDHDALLGVITLEAHRAGAVVIGEDLGTVTPAVRRELGDRGVLGTSVLWFERESSRDGEPGPLRPPARWREAATASVTTHDLPTALGWLRGEHVRVRAEVGALDDPAAEEKSWQAEREELLALLRDEGLVGADPTEEELVVALHLALGRTPCRLVLAQLADAVGDLRQPNLPATVDEYPNWRLPVADSDGRPMLLEELLADTRVQRLAAELSAAVR